MPLIKSSSDEAREKNIAEMIHSGHPVNQAVAAGYSVQRDAEHEKRKSERHQYEKDKYGKS